MQEIEQVKRDVNNLNSKLDMLLRYLNIVVDYDYTLFEWLDKWLTDYKISRYGNSSGIKNIKNIIKVHICPNISNYKLSELNAINVMQALNAVNTSRMRAYTYDVYNESLTKAFNLGLMAKNIMPGVERPIHIKKKGTALTLEQQRQFLYLIRNHPKKLLYQFYLCSGVRLSEALSITTDDVDTIKGRIHIRGTKSISSNRYIPITRDIEKILSKIGVKSGRLFPYSVNAVKCSFRRLKIEYDLPYTIHSFRHTYATRLMENGANIKYIQAVLGHADYKITANTYVDVLDDYFIKESRKIQANILK